MTTRYKAIFEHDTDPDFSWLGQSHYNPRHSAYEPVYPTVDDMQKGTNAYDGDWYRNPRNHVALSMRVYRLSEDDADWELIDSLGSIDFLTISNDWKTGTFYQPEHLATCPYLRELFEDAIAEDQRKS